MCIITAFLLDLFHYCTEVYCKLTHWHSLLDILINEIRFTPQEPIFYKPIQLYQELYAERR